jgi:hypothetical protein
MLSSKKSNSKISWDLKRSSNDLFIILIVGVFVTLLGLLLRLSSSKRSPHKRNFSKRPLHAGQIHLSAFPKAKPQQAPQDFVPPKRALSHTEQDNPYQTKKPNEVVYPYEKHRSAGLH